MAFRICQLGPDDLPAARAVCAAMAAGFEEEPAALSDVYLHALLSRPDFWLLGAFDEETAVGGLTAHLLPMTNREATEVFIYDVAVAPAQQGRGAGTALLREVRRLAGEHGASAVFVPADNEDLHALAFYEANGGDGAAVTIYTYEPG